MAEEADAPIPNEPATRGAPSTSATDSPGQQLRQAREARKLDVSQLATSLRVAPQVVEALEQDNYQQLPSAVFVSGYIRSYARLVGLDPEPLNQSFRRLHPNAEPAPPHVARAGSSQSTEDNPEGGGLAVYLIAALVVLALAAGGYGWWVSRPGPTQQTTEQADLEEDRLPAQPSTGAPLDDEPRQQAFYQESESPTAPAPENGIDSASTSLSAREAGSTGTAQTASSDVVVMGQGEQRRTSAASLASEAQPAMTSEASARAAEETPLDLSAAASAGDAAVRQPASRPLPSPASPVDERPTVNQTASLTADTGAADTQTEADSEAEDTTDSAPANSASQTVELAFNGPCWVDIRDSTGEVLLFGEMSRDSREILGGEPPYSLVIGNAAAAEVTVAGQPFDLDPIARGNVARFKLDPSEVSRQTTDASANPRPNAATEQSN